MSHSRSFWLVTFVTYNSRVSGRMEIFGSGAAPPIIFTANDQLQIAKSLVDTWTKLHVPVIAANILPDHVHAVIAAVDKIELQHFVQKLKGQSAFSFHKTSSQLSTHCWQQKFNRKLLTTTESLRLACEYVHNNHLKHVERWGEAALGMNRTSPSVSDKGLKPLASSRDRIITLFKDATVSIESILNS